MNKTLEKFIPTANMIAETFGEDCQVAIHDLTTPQNTVAYMVNGHVTGNDVSRGFHNMTAQLLLSQSHADSYSSNYWFATEDKRLIKSSASLISDENGMVIGAFCINIDTKKTTDFVNFLLEALSDIPNVEAFSGKEALLKQSEAEHISQIVDELITHIIGEKNAAQMSRDEKVHVINIMEQKGLFLVKGTIEKVAEKLGIAKVTVYSYLDEIKDKNDK